MTTTIALAGKGGAGKTRALMQLVCWRLSWLCVLIAASLSVFLFLVFGSGRVSAQGQFPPVGVNIEFVADDGGTVSCNLLSKEVYGATPTRPDLLPSFQLQASGVPTYYLDDDAREVHLSHPPNDQGYWEYGCFETQAEAEVRAVTFRTRETGDCPQFKPMSGQHGGCSGQNLWGDTSEELDGDDHWCYGEAEACEAIAPDATYIPHGWNGDKEAGTPLRGGFKLGWAGACSAEADVYDIRLVYYDVPPALPADQSNAPCDCPIGCSSQTQNWVGTPINTRTGNLHYSQRDISISALGGPLYFERSYNSLETDLYTATLGYGWTHNYDVDLTFPGDPGGEPDTIIVKGCRGSRFRFAEITPGVYEPYPGVWATLILTGSEYVLRGVDTGMYTFDSAGRLIEIQTPEGYTFTLTFDQERLDQVADEMGQRYLTFTYYGDGRLRQVRDPFSRTVTYTYTNGNLSGVTDLRGETWLYTYQASTHLLRDARDPNGHVVERTEHEGGRAVRQWRGFEVGETPGLAEALQIVYQPDGTTVITDPLGHVTIDLYNGHGALGLQGDASGVFSRTYDANLNWRTTTDANGRTTRYVFNSMGLPEQVTDARDRATRMQYDDLDHLTAITDALNHVTRYEYDGNLLTTVTDALGGDVFKTYDRGLLVQVVDHGVTTAYGYDEWGQLAAMTDTGNLELHGHVTRYEYDGVGRLVTTTNPIGQMTVNEYDAGDHLVRVTRNFSAAGGQNYLDAYNLVTEYGYDAVGNRVAVTDTLGRVTRSWYDAANRLVSATVNYSPTASANYDGQWNLTTGYAYDAVGKQVAVTDTLGRVTRHWYDDVDRLVRTTANYSPTVGPNYDDQWNLTTEYAYDAVGNQTRVTNALSHATRYEYDDLNRLIIVTDPLSGTIRYGYDALGRQTVVTDADGVATYSVYDALGRLVEARDALSHTTRYTFDAHGRQETARDANGVVTRYEYDLLGRQIAVVANYAPTLPADHQTNARTEYGYDALGHRTVVTDANGHVSRFIYDAAGRLTMEIDPLGHTTGYDYDALGNRTVVTDADGGVTVYAYDALDRLTVIQYPDSTVEYAYGPLGNRTALTDSTGTTTYVYDHLHRPLTIASPSTGTVGYRYDALGNRARLIYPSGETVTNTYDAAGRLRTMTDWTGGETEYGYTAAGRLSWERLPNGVETRRQYDEAGRWVALTRNGSGQPLLSYFYTLDGVGNRVRVVEGVYHWVYLPLVLRGAGGAVSDVTAASITSSEKASAPPGGTRAIEYRYDPLNRLTSAVYSTGEQFEYRYDVAGNRTTMTSTTPLSGTLVTHYVYDDANRLSDRAVSDGRSYTYDWSNRGQLLREWTQGVPVRAFTYDGAGRLAEATVFTLTTSFTYNGVGSRVAVEVAGHDATQVVLDYGSGNRILVEETITGTVQYLYGHGCLGEYRDGEPGLSGAEGWLYYLDDGGGYVRQGANVQGEVVSSWLFDPSGTMLEGPEGPVSHLVCGGVYDWSTGLIYKGGNYFDPSLGIWLALMPLVVVQSWRGRKKRRCVLWVTLLLVVVGVSGTLTSCGGGMTTPAPTVCVEVPSPLPPLPTFTPLPAFVPTATPSYAVPGFTNLPTVEIPSSPMPSPSPLPTPLLTPTDADVIATARAAALEAGGLGIWDTNENRNLVLGALAWVVRNRVGTAGFNCNTAEQCASNTVQFQAVGRDPTYGPTQHEQSVARSVLTAPQSEDSTGGSVYFHDITAAPGSAWQLYLVNPSRAYGFYFYTSEQCPGGPRPGGVGCSFVLTSTP